MFSKFSINQRMIILIALAGSVAGLIAVALWTQQPDMQVLFTNLNGEDAAAIIDKLKETKVPYETTGGGSTVLVPSAQVHDLRLQLATQGLPHGGGVGYEIFDRTSIGMSEFVQKLNYRRALQGELARTIAQMPEVERARVHLAIPERRLFANEQDRARASVILSLRNGQLLTKAQVQGVVHLVASSVEGLQTRDVTVVDGHGNMLSSTAAADETAGLTNTQLEYQRAIEKDIETRIQTMLERIVGLNKAVVRVSSVVDFRKVETTEERYDPNGQVVRSEQRGQEKSNGVNGVSGGVPGVQSNVPPGTDLEPAQTSSSNSATKNETVNYEISRTVSRIVEPIGTIKKLSVAVLVDGLYEPAKAAEAGATAGEPAKKYVPRSEEDMKRIEEIVKKAMGYNAERQDQVQVVNVQFGFGPEEPQTAAVEAVAEESKPWVPYLRYAVGALLFLMILLFVVRPLIAMLGATAAAPEMAADAPALPASVGAVEASLATGPDRAQIIDLARKNPDTTAVVVKQWLKGA
ncbi:flagellar basal-body MS-ring/collar protein FliF [Nitrospira moscoviensis]|uniref:Flagellar M-ring protein n=1 Tax=Nitrospira moscoviensis TaxID=42253 RepID=A0A0K2GBK8_NITMO|nr:flagellar basal-body MS-ring/collar protein FliF [Nitrospira moscoviensis]ALA58335.1 Flagellar M-ring protein FliF [Nitrospira moscoviensis]